MISGLYPLVTTPGNAQDTITTFNTTVHRVIVNVVVTDANGNPASGFTKNDFTLQEDGNPQKLSSLNPNGFRQARNYPPVRGPLYVLLYDLVNMDKPDQMALTVNQRSDQV